MRHDEPEDADSTLDLLLHRALERTASDRDWQELEQRAERDPATWRVLALLLRDECRLAAVGGDLVSAAAGVELSEPPAGAKPLRRSFAWPRAGGGIAAAAFFLLWVATALRLPTAVVLPPAQPSQTVAGDEGGEESEVALGELPKLLVDARRSGDAWELVYLRREYQRVRVPRVYSLGSDENGNAAAIPLSFASIQDGEEL